MSEGLLTAGLLLTAAIREPVENLGIVVFAAAAASIALLLMLCCWLLVGVQGAFAAASGDPSAYARTQFETTMNVDCPTWLDWFHGGLQFQIEHHLFPHVPSNQLRLVKPQVEAICREAGLRYHEVSFPTALLDLKPKYPHPQSI